MDLGTVVGLVLAFALIAGAMMIGGGVAPFMDAQSAMIVIGGTFAETMVCQKLPNVMAAMSLLMRAVYDRTSPMDELIPVIIHLAAKARKERLVSLEGETIASRCASECFEGSGAHRASLQCSGVVWFAGGW